MVHLSGPITAAIVLLQPEKAAGKLLVLFPQLGNPEWRWSQCECETTENPRTTHTDSTENSCDSAGAGVQLWLRGAASAVFAAAEHLPPGQVRRIATQICVDCQYLCEESSRTSEHKSKKLPSQTWVTSQKKTVKTSGRRSKRRCFCSFFCSVERSLASNSCGHKRPKKGRD